jgi:hypothetical protein
VTGPRDYSAGTERALFDLAQGTCYYPGCSTRAIAFIEGAPITNVQLAHILGANPGSPRFEPAMSDKERASFDNLVLLCKPHHDLVDRVDPDRFPADVLKKWKKDREGPGIAALHGLQGLTESRLADMLEAAICTASPQRAVTLEVAAGFLLKGRSAITIPLDAWRAVLEINRHMTDPWVVIATVRNTGGLPASVTSVSIWFRVEAGGAQFETSLMGRDDFPSLNPSLPTRLDIGESTSWLTSPGTFELMASQVASILKGGVTEFRVEVALGSGEKITSAWYAIQLLPLGRT